MMPSTIHIESQPIRIGNAAEWTREGKGIVARGGSFRSEQAAELKAWASEKASVPSAHIGSRCAYDKPKG